MLIRERQKDKKISASRDVVAIMSTIYRERSEEERHKEYVYAIGLDSQNRLLYVDLVAIGTVNFAVPPVREILRMAIMKNACALIAIHNHPSGDTRPSADDRMFTKRLHEACDNIQIKCLDHIIIGTDAEEPPAFYSFRESEGW